jgi:hypothetical protein
VAPALSCSISLRAQVAAQPALVHVQILPTSRSGGRPRCKGKKNGSQVVLRVSARAAATPVEDVQVNVLANAWAYTRPPDSGDLAAALKVAREMSVIGVVELFDESLVAAEYFFASGVSRDPV